MAHFHLIDGGLSTELQRIGANVEGELWTGRALLDDPAKVLEAHREFALAGAEVVISASYQLSRKGFEEIGLTAEEADQALVNSIAVARAAVEGTDAKVAASVGPYGAVLHDGSEYRGDYEVTQEQLQAFHAERLAVLIEAGPDLLAIETIPNVVEAKALAEVLKTVSLPKWISFTAGTEDSLWSGEPIGEAVAAIAELPNLVAVGVNCVDPANVVGLVGHIKNVTDAPIVVYPNRGGTWDSAAGVWIGEKPKTLNEWLPEWLEAGVSYVGGCCGTDSNDIRALAAAR